MEKGERGKHEAGKQSHETNEMRHEGEGLEDWSARPSCTGLDQVLKRAGLGALQSRDDGCEWMMNWVWGICGCFASLIIPVPR
jgi:hypothetical protein